MPRESALAKAQQIAEAELEALGWTVKDLQGRRKSDPQKVRIAARLRRETTVGLEWIAACSFMGAISFFPSAAVRAIIDSRTKH